MSLPACLTTWQQGSGVETEDGEHDCAQLFHADELFLHNASIVAFGRTTSLENKQEKGVSEHL